MPNYTKEWHISNCLRCNKEVKTSHGRWTRGRGKYCSMICKWIDCGKRKVGTKESLETRTKKSLAIRGEKHHSWKGGNTGLVARIRQSLMYKLWRSEVLSRDNYSCRECGIRGGSRFEIHHIVSFALTVNKNGVKSIEDADKCKDLWNLDNAITLCKNCHKKTFKQEQHKVATVINQPSKWSKDSIKMSIGRYQ